MVGGGLAGLTVAARLAENPAVTVGVIEAGDFYEKANGNRSRVPGYAGQPSVDEVEWTVTTTPQADLMGRTAVYRGGKCLGGSSAINLMGYQRSSTGAYDRWASFVGSSSYTFRNFLPWLKKSVHYTPPNMAVRAKNASVPAPSAQSYDQTGGPLQITLPNWASPASSYAEAGWKSLGLQPIPDFTSGALIGNQYTPLTLKPADQSRHTSATSFLEYAVRSGRNNLFVLTNTIATRVVIDNTKRARSVVAKSNRGTFELKANQEIVLSAGVMHTPQLLMLSGVGPSSTLKQYNIPVVKDLPGVGQNMKDHPIFQFAYEVDVVTTSSLRDPAAAARAAAEYNEKHTGILTHNLADQFAYGKIPLEQLSSEAQPYLKSLPADWPHFLLATSDFPYPLPSGNFVQGVVMLQAVSSRGSITISSSSIDDDPVMDVRTYSTKTDREVAVRVAQLMRKYFNTPSLKRINKGEVRPGLNVGSDDASLLSWLRNNTSPGLHGCCTAAMGKAGDKNAVVDAGGRVIGVKGLRVVDASALPFLTPGNPIATLCERSFLCYGALLLTVMRRCTRGETCRRYETESEYIA